MRVKQLEKKLNVLFLEVATIYSVLCRMND